MAIHPLNPAYKDYLWGGNKLKSEYHKSNDLKITAESWEVSTHPDGLTTLSTGQTLADYLNEDIKKHLGTQFSNNETLPVLVKFIDAKKDLSIQVHPDDAYAHRHEHDNGKTEMWIILEAEPDATLYYGLNQSLTQSSFKAAIENSTLLESLNCVPVHPGDIIFVPAGTLHAIGAGIVVLEIQQSSNSTYRVYDFDRKDADGNLRELHIDKAIDVSNLNPSVIDFTPQYEPEETAYGKHTVLRACEYFTVESFEVEHSGTLHLSGNTYNALVCIEGKLTLADDQQTLDLAKGNSVFIDAETESFTFSGNGRFVLISNP